MLNDDEDNDEECLSACEIGMIEHMMPFSQRNKKRYLSCRSSFTPPENMRLQKRKNLVKNEPVMHRRTIN